MLFVGPEVSQFVKLVGRTEVPEVLSPLRCSEKELVLFCVNNLENPEEAGGSHWSLLGRLALLNLKRKV